MTNELRGPVTVPLDRLRADESWQPREAGIKDAHVRLLAGTDPAVWPPLLVTPNDDGGFDVVDGFHRLAAAQKLGLPTLPCIVDPDAGYFDAVGANATHGLPLSIADRKAAARWLTECEPGLSLREVGRRCGLNHETVRRALEEDLDPVGGGRQAPQPDPIGRLVRQVDRTYRGGSGRTWLGFGKSGSPAPFRRALEAYAEEDRPTVARALDAFGRACLEAAGPYVADGGSQ